MCAGVPTVQITALHKVKSHEPSGRPLMPRRVSFGGSFEPEEERSTFQVKVNTSAAKRSFFTKNALFDSSTFMRRSKSSTLFKRALTSREPDKSERR